jgi:hypothetical protein
MKVASRPARSERHVYLWMLATGPAVWAAHFFLSYITSAVWCAKFAGRDESLGPMHWVIGWYTAIALAAIVWIGISGYRRHGRGFATDEHHLDTADDRRRFLGFAALLLAGLSAVATIYAAVSVAFVHQCY